ncbi:hypothetical protein VCR4J2_40052 [Vibrio coralliirubri]|nr:hypothetical protein VCR4J2_40052 [Vibrio coralliirubri]
MVLAEDGRLLHASKTSKIDAIETVFEGLTSAIDGTRGH